MQTNNLFACVATGDGLHILTARNTEVALLFPPDVAVLSSVRLRAVELDWLARAAQDFSRLHSAALAAGAQKTHPLTLLPEPEAV